MRLSARSSRLGRVCPYRCDSDGTLTLLFRDGAGDRGVRFWVVVWEGGLTIDGGDRGSSHCDDAQISLFTLCFYHHNHNFLFFTAAGSQPLGGWQGGATPPLPPVLGARSYARTGESYIFAEESSYSK